MFPFRLILFPSSLEFLATCIYSTVFKSSASDTSLAEFELDANKVS